MTRDAFRDLVASGPVVLDGATGSNLMKAGINAVVTGLLFKHLEVVAKKFIMN